MRQYLWLISIFLLSCHNRQDKTTSATTIIDTVHQVQAAKPKDTTKLEESFTDSLNIGKRTFNKMEISQYGTADSDYVIIKFYSKQNDKWILKNDFQFKKDDVMGCDTKITDFNNDGYNDMTYISDVAARGANEIRRLFIYDKSEDKLVYMKNSEDYPNLRYNKELNCIDAFLVYGGCSSVFLRISGDSLKEFANVELMDGLTVTEYLKNGKARVVLRDTANKANYVRYKNYHPLEEYDDTLQSTKP